MDWDDVRYFLALARDGSVRGAGAALGVSHSTVARRVAALEDRLQTRLFDRSRDGYALTEAGRETLSRAERMEREMAALERSLVGQDTRLSGRVTLTVCDSFVAAIVLGDLREFCAAHPEVEVDLIQDSRPFDLAKREADIAIRALGRNQEPPSYLVGRRVAPIVIGNYVSRRYASQVGPHAPQARWLGFDDRGFQEQVIADSSYPEVPAWGAFSSLETATIAATEGYGMAMLPIYAADAVPQLRRLEKPDLRHMADLWLLYHPDLRDNARVCAMRDCIRASFDRHQETFSPG